MVDALDLGEAPGESKPKRFSGLSRIVRSIQFEICCDFVLACSGVKIEEAIGYVAAIRLISRCSIALKSRGVAKFLSYSVLLNDLPLSSSRKPKWIRVLGSRDLEFRPEAAFRVVDARLTELRAKGAEISELVVWSSEDDVGL